MLNGIYSFSFGTNKTGMVTALANPEAWLEVKIDGVPLTPRQRLVAVPYAYHVRGLTVATSGNAGISPDGGFPNIEDDPSC